MKKFYYVESGTQIIPKDNNKYSFDFYQIKRPARYIYSYDYQLDEAWLEPDVTYSMQDIRGEYVFDVSNMPEYQRGYISINSEGDGFELVNSCGDLKALEQEYIDSKVDEYINRHDVQSEIVDTAHKINKYAGSNRKIVTLLSDTHYVLNGNWEYTLATIENVYEKITDVSVSGIIHLGDFTDGILDKDTCRDYSHRVIDGLRKLDKPLHIALGNHDANYFRNNPDILSDSEQSNMYLGGTNVFYKARIKDSNIVLLVLSAYDNKEKNRYGFTNEQLEWIKSELAICDESDKELQQRSRIMLLSHDAPLAKLDYWASEIRGGEELCNILDEWNVAHNHRIIGFLHGHTHADYIYCERSFPIISVGCSKIEYFEDKKPTGAFCSVRVENEVSQELWDTLAIDEETGDIDIIRFGAGVDRHVEGRILSDMDGNVENNRINCPAIWAHRGASGYAPENTMESFELAVALGAEGIELDVQYTKDRQLIVLHDESIDRTSDGHGMVSDYTLDELRKFNFNKTHPEYVHCDIPLLEDVLKLIKPTNMIINIELKTGVMFYPGIEQDVLALVDKYDMQDQVIYSSFNHQSVTRIKELRPELQCGFLYCDGTINMVEYAKQYKMDALHPAIYNTRYDGFVEECKNNGMKLHVWTVNTEDHMEKMRQIGVDAIITNYPDIARKQYYGEDLGGILEQTKQKQIEHCLERKQAMNEAVTAGKKSGVLHVLGESYRVIRKPFVSFDRFVQRMAGK